MYFNGNPRNLVGKISVVSILNYSARVNDNENLVISQYGKFSVEKAKIQMASVEKAKIQMAPLL
jgi:hypothetical protein